DRRLSGKPRMNELAWVDGRILPLAEARIALDSPGFLLGDGVFETLRTRRGRVFRWDLHAARFAKGLAALDIAPAALPIAERAARELAGAAANCEDDLSLRVQVSRDASGIGEVSALIRPLPPRVERLYREGARLAIATSRRDPADPLAGVKSLSYLPQVLARRAARARGFDDALILNTPGRVCEAAHANVIARSGRRLYAPGREEGALDGVTRRVLLDDIAAGEDELQFRLERSELEAAEELVLTSTLAGVIPVASIEGVAKSYAGSAGELARGLARRYEVLLESGV
ncbi:MAG TPA: aminotransferase class IV, partial [Gammaproteobacteria bacterium]|nr:aminotransferase class IV [Gammaproteobacteria bacterium]